MVRLTWQIRIVVSHVNSEPFRKAAAREAADIPLTFCEKFRTVKGDLCQRARAIMKALPDLPVEERGDAARDLGFILSLLEADDPGAVVSETKLGERRRA